MVCGLYGNRIEASLQKNSACDNGREKMYKLQYKSAFAKYP
jgi:hypothetical protein